MKKTNQNRSMQGRAEKTDLAEDIQARTAVDDAILTRRSVRAFVNDPVPLDLVRHILDVARRAPSGTNVQPWKVHVLVGPKKKVLTEAIHQAFRDEEAQKSGRYKPDYDYYPKTWREPYISRRRKLGWALYSLLGIGKRDLERMRKQQARNYQFFDAPVGLIFTVDAVFEKGSWLDYGMFINNIMIAARGHGLHTCAQAAFSNYHEIVREVLGIPANQTVIAGLAMGYEDETAPENRLRSERVVLEEFVTFHTAGQKEQRGKG